MVEDGLVCLGDRSLVDAYVARVQAANHLSLADLGVTTQSLADLGAAASSLAAFHASAGTYFRMSPDSLEKFRQLNLVPGADGYFKGIVRGSSGHWAGNLDFQAISFGAEQAISLQLAMATASLRAAIKDVQKAVERVEGKVDILVARAKADMLGRVIGQHRILAHHASRLDDNGQLPATDWESVASMGPKLVEGIETLRQFLREQVKTLDGAEPAQDRADALREAMEQNRLGEVLQLLVVAEDSHYLWQRLRIERARINEPHNLESVIESAQQQLRDDLRLDGDMLAHLREALMDFATLRPLEIHRRWSRTKLEKDVQELRSEFDEFARARRMQVTSWPELRRPTIDDWGREVQQRTMGAGRAAKDAGTRAIDYTAGHARSAGDVIEQQTQEARDAIRQIWTNRRKP